MNNEHQNITNEELIEMRADVQACGTQLLNWMRRNEISPLTMAAACIQLAAELDAIVAVGNGVELQVMLDSRMAAYRIRFAERADLEQLATGLTQGHA